MTTHTNRMRRAEKCALAKEIAAKAQALLAECGAPEMISRHQFAAAQMGDLKILLTTPFSGVKTGHPDFRYQVNMWHKKIGKVFGASWEPQKPWANDFECFRLVKGEWVDAFLAGGK